MDWPARRLKWAERGAVSGGGEQWRYLRDLAAAYGERELALRAHRKIEGDAVTELVPTSSRAAITVVGPEQELRRIWLTEVLDEIGWKSNETEDDGFEISVDSSSELVDALRLHPELEWRDET